MPSSVSVSNVFPQSRTEFVTAFAHYYRAEMSRAISWRDRLVRTTNWAIAGTAGILSVSLSQPEKHHGLLIFAMAVVFLLLVIESRRYQFFDVYRSRVRVFETAYYARIMTPAEGPSGEEWQSRLGEELRAPHVTLTLMEAMAHRLRRNYCWIFLILLAAWLLKVEGSLAFTEILTKPADLHLRAEVGWTPGWAVLVAVLGFHAWLVYIMIRHGGATREPVMREV